MFLIVPEEKECFAVRFLLGIAGVPSEDLVPLLVVNALERDIFAECGSYATFAPGKDGLQNLFFLPPTRSLVVGR